MSDHITKWNSFDYILYISNGRSAVHVKPYCLESSTYANSF